jgi:lipopolysaccharide/colanic/teichoic acid biosynthesis glycosyltransferase
MLKRAFDVGLSSLALLVTAPILAIAAVAIRLSSPGPVLYRATRVGRGGQPFTMFKLRTMHLNQAVVGGKLATSAITARDDPRVFAVGRVLRQTKIDELPQLWNVLRGDMSLVGPRPEDPRFVEKNYTPVQLTTLDVQPGLTSPGSVWYYTSAESGVASDDPERHYVEQILPLKLALDLVYVRGASWWYDVTLIARTIFVLAALSVGRRQFRDPPEMSAARRLVTQS